MGHQAAASVAARLRRLVLGCVLGCVHPEAAQRKGAYGSGVPGVRYAARARLPRAPRSFKVSDSVSDYVQRRMAQLGITPRKPPARRPRAAPQPLRIPPRPLRTFSAEAHDYVRKVRRKTDDPATWFDVARAFNAGRATDPTTSPR